MTGGGTLGSVSPLLAVVEQLKAEGDKITFVGTVRGPERTLVEEAGIPFFTIVAPKLRRYLSLWHLAVPFQLGFGLWQALVIVARQRPQVIVSAGGYVAVPLVWVGWFFRIPSVIHQQDIQPSLTNKLLAPCASRITVGFESSLQDYPAKKTSWIGNPVRDLTPTTNRLKLDDSLPTVMIFGGGTGAKAINQLVTKELCDSMNVVHITGRGRGAGSFSHPRYHAYELLGEEMKEAYASAAVVVARAGLGTITELAALKKPAIIIPMPNTHQEPNAQLLKEREAAVVLDQRELTPESFRGQIQLLLGSSAQQEKLSTNLGALFPEESNQQFIKAIHASK